jgi:hypothetical protein
MRFSLGKHVSKTIAEVWKAGDIMVSSNKILTVSYGTFSCTLEGFDNSFDTMKAIAEYFRDLAQDDRYFGAEPPTPDAEMLARIAEREIARRVEARFEKGNLVLRASEDAETPHGDVAPEQSRDAAKEDATAGVAATALAVAAQSAEADAAIADPYEGSEIATTDVDLSDIDLSDLDLSDTAGGQSDTSEDVAEDALEDVSEDVVTDFTDLSIETEEDDAFSADDILDAEETTGAETSIEDLIAEQGEKAERRAEADAYAAQEATETPVVTDSVAEKLQRIRAVVASKAQATPEYIEDEHAMSGPDGDGIEENDAIDATEVSALDDNLFTDTIAAVVSDQLDVEAEDEEDALLPEMSDDDEDDFEDVIAPVAHDTPSELEILRAKIAALEAAAAAQSEAPTEHTSVETADDLDPVMSLEDEDGLGDDEDDALFRTEEDENDTLTFDDEDEDDDEDNAPLVLEDAVAAVDDTDDQDDEPKPFVAHVAKAKRADVEAALAAGRLEEYDDEDEDDDAPIAAVRPIPGLEDSSLTPEQEAELARELADLHAEIDEDEDWDFDDDDDDDDTQFLTEAEEESASANIRKAVKLTSPARAMLTDTSIEEDAGSVERLVDKTDTEMEEPEGNRRRSAIAHLRAAVAATKADRILGFGKKTVDEEEPYREDLADAVRPRRPKVTETRSARPAPVRPAPLKLVAEQRIDVEAETDAAPIRPRRVMRNVEPVEAADMGAGTDEGFAEFAENQGAHTLPELLEAAAAYMSFVEGRDQFSRPQLMTKLLQAEGEASSREERLRSFGQLLRDGKIEKKGGGRFAASDSIGFKPDARAAG